MGDNRDPMEVEDMERRIRAGVAAGLSDPQIAEQIGRSARTVLRARQALGLDTPLPQYTPDSIPEFDAQIVALLHKGHTYKAIGRALGRSPKTIAARVRRLNQKDAA